MRRFFLLAAAVCAGCYTPPAPNRAPATPAQQTTPAPPAPKPPDGLLIEFRKRFAPFEEEARSAFNLAADGTSRAELLKRKALLDDLLSRFPDVPPEQKDLREQMENCRLVPMKLTLIEMAFGYHQKFIELDEPEKAREPLKTVGELVESGKRLLAAIRGQLDLMEQRQATPLAAPPPRP